MTYYYKILIFSFIIPFIFSFHPKLKFYKKFNLILKSIPITALPYIIWDIFFTKWGIWSFSNIHSSNIYIYNLPIEEVLFFLIIPFCCIYTFHALEIYNISFFKSKNWKLINTILAIILIIIGLANYSRFYTLVCFVLCAAIILIISNIQNNIDYNLFYTFFIIIMIPFIIVNGALTGAFFDQTVVSYNPNEFLGYRLITIPLEDIIYSYQLMLVNIFIYKNLDTK